MTDEKGKSPWASMSDLGAEMDASLAQHPDLQEAVDAALGGVLALSLLAAGDDKRMQVASNALASISTAAQATGIAMHSQVVTYRFLKAVGVLK